MSERTAIPFEADPIAHIDAVQIAEFALLRLCRGLNPMRNLEAKLQSEQTRSPETADIITMLAEMASLSFEPESLDSVVSINSYQYGAASALDLLDSICYQLGVSVTAYRNSLLRGDSVVSTALLIDPSEDERGFRSNVSRAILQMGTQQLAHIEPEYVAYIQALLASDHVASSVKDEPFLSGFGTMYRNGRKAVVAHIESTLDYDSRQIVGSSSQIDAELIGLLSVE